ncbi:scopoletin glucosyltransferase-like [Ananas comosus]|uniref:Glycosyltransferase n=1 Tax=Ananas comosus TaxID=4615 RepID=A0A6P5G269_ANACO|nr:scopoletin glucosyltransferase-like [Ananas comosus]
MGADSILPQQTPAMDVHIFFLPFLSPGHMIPMVDLACVCAARGAKATVVTTPGNFPLIRPILDLTNSGSSLPDPVRLLSLPFLSPDSGLPDGFENLLAFPNPDVTPEMSAAIELLQRPFVDLIRQHRPDCVISDLHFPWARDVLGVPRIVFHGTGCFSQIVLGTLSLLGTQKVASHGDEPFAVPGLPHNVELTCSRLPRFLITPDEALIRMGEAYGKSDGAVMNSFYYLEPDYADLMKQWGGMKVWLVGPVSVYNRDIKHRAVRGGVASVGYDDILNWLDGKKAGSVIYVCFGSLGRFTVAQLREIALGLENSEHPFIWVMRYDGDLSEFLPAGFGERKKGMVINGWAPQLAILSHGSVGGFVTHCGWNSLLEGASAGVPMITWPLFAEQFINEKLIVHVLRIGVAIGSDKCCNYAEERTAVAAEEVRKAVGELMGGGEEAVGRRERAKEIGEKAKRAVEEGGSSYDEVGSLIEHLRSLKMN